MRRLFAFVAPIMMLICTNLLGQNTSAPNIIFIFCDDLIEISDAFGPGFQAQTPNINRLRERGASFTNTCSNATICGPSRASVFTGILPVNSGHFGYKMGAIPWTSNPILASSTNMFRHFKNNGYQVFATGKIFHGGTSNADDFTELNVVDRGPFVWDGVTMNTNAIPQQVVFPGNPLFVANEAGGGIVAFSELESYPGYQWIYSSGAIFNPNDSEHLTMDEQIAAYGIDILQQDHTSPFFLTLGFFAPHTPLYAPDRIFDLYPLADISASMFIDEPESSRTVAVEKNRWNSTVNTPALSGILNTGTDHSVENYWLKKYIQGYLALVSLVDEQLGLLLDALDASPYADNTYIIFSSDHGFQLGEKNMIKKNTLWNGSARVPLIVAGPGIGNDIKLANPASLVDIYPSIIEVAGIAPPTTHTLDGHSLVPLLNGTPENFSGPGYVLISSPSNETLDNQGIIANKNHQHYSVFSDLYRYNYYSSGEEELYLVGDDPLELMNAIALPEFQLVRKNQRNILTQQFGITLADPVRHNSIFYGDFSQNLNGWLKSRPGPNSLIIQQDQSTEHIGNYMRITRTNNDLLFGALNRSVELKQGHDYEMCITARGSNYDGLIKLEIQSDNEYTDNSAAIHQFTTGVTNNWQEYCYTFTETEGEGKFSRMLLVSPLIQGSVDIDNIVLTDLTKKAQLQQPALEAVVIEPAISYQASVHSINAHYLDNCVEGCFDSGSALVSFQGWFKFVAPAREVNIWAKGGVDFDTTIELYSDLTNGPLVCSNAASVGEAENKVVKNLIIGNTYYVRVSHAGLDVVTTSLISTGVVYVAPTSLTPAYCNAGIFNSSIEFRLTSLPHYSNLTNWQLAVQSSAAPSDTAYILLPPLVPPVFNLSSFSNSLVPGAVYTVRARARQFAGPIWGEFGPACELTYLQTMPNAANFSLGTELYENIVTLFPNPSSGEEISVHISDGEKIPVQVWLYDCIGRLLNISVLSQGNDTFKIVPQAPLSNGIYSVIIKFDEEHRISRLIAVANQIR